MSGNEIVQAIDCVERTLIIFVCYSFSKYQNVCPQKYDNVYYKWKQIYLHLEYKIQYKYKYQNCCINIRFL